MIVVMPAYNAAQTSLAANGTMRFHMTSSMKFFLVNAANNSVMTLHRCKTDGLTVFCHDRNYGYGRNQKTCYLEALRRGAGVLVVMIHPDYQYTPRLALAMASMIASGLYDITLGSRILGGGALRGGMALIQICVQSNPYCGPKLASWK